MSYGIHRCIHIKFITISSVVVVKNPESIRLKLLNRPTIATQSHARDVL